MMNLNLPIYLNSKTRHCERSDSMRGGRSNPPVFSTSQHRSILLSGFGDCFTRLLRVRNDVFVVCMILGMNFSSVLHSQQIPLHSQYLWNDYIINPAIAGTKQGVPVFLSYRTQWYGLEGAPVTQLGGMHGAVNDKMGLGLLLVDDQTGPTHRSSFQLGYSYRLKITEKYNFSFGFSPTVMLYSLKKSSLTFDQPDAFAEGVSGESVVMDATAGAYFWTDHYFAGFSVPQMLENRIWEGDRTTYARLKRHYLLYGGYELAVNEKFSLLPSLFFRYEMGSPVQWDLNAKLNYNRFLWMGISHRANSSSHFNDAFVILLGVSKQNITAGYAFDYSFSRLQKSSVGSHEVFISYTIKPREKLISETKE